MCSHVIICVIIPVIDSTTKSSWLAAYFEKLKLKILYLKNIEMNLE